MAAAAGQLARELLVPDLTLIEAAAVDVAPHDVITPMVQPEVVASEAVGVYTQADILDAIQRGRVSLQFVSPAQVDAAGRINTSRVRGGDGSLRRLPGGLAHPDIACLIGRLVAYRASHERRFLPERVPVTEPPPPEALRLLREEIDPHGMRRLETREGRAAALRELETMS
jgi:acyl CoA:acetate/3-ketoacid CoA transferase beta subunit